MLEDAKSKCETKMIKYHKLLKEIEDDVEEGKIEFTGHAFVTFKCAEEAKLALENIRRPKRLNAAWTKLRHLLCFYVTRSRNPFLGRKVIV